MTLKSGQQKLLKQLASIFSGEASLDSFTTKQRKRLAKIDPADLKYGKTLKLFGLDADELSRQGFQDIKTKFKAILDKGKIGKGELANFAAFATKTFQEELVPAGGQAPRRGLPYGMAQYARLQVSGARGVADTIHTSPTGDPRFGTRLSRPRVTRLKAG